MSTEPAQPLTLGQVALAARCSLVAQDIANQGYAVCTEFLPVGDTLALLQRVQEDQSADQMQAAGVGRGSDFQTNYFVRQDQIRWLQAECATERSFLTCMEALRLAVNRALFMGLFDYEAHFAVYPPGAFYKKHVDAFQGHTNRRLSTVLYLNFDWQPSDGGELRCYDPVDDQRILFDLTPQAGTLLVFESDRFWHEVLPAQRHRFSIAGWFRVNMSTGRRADPAQ
ncbi:MAG: 2OG-Fe(II) oxygenase [Natronospirillum sp.]